MRSRFVTRGQGGGWEIDITDQKPIDSAAFLSAIGNDSQKALFQFRGWATRGFQAPYLLPERA